MKRPKHVGAGRVGPEPRTLRLTDPTQMRALAHPLRLQLLGQLRADGPATATTLSERAGVSVPLASYHLRQLAAHGFIEEAPELANDGRERWWRASHERTNWSAVDWLDTPERIAVETAFGRAVVQRYHEVMQGWLDAAPSWPAEWIEASDMSDWLVEVTVEELKALHGELASVVERYAAKPKHPGSRGIHAMVQLFPRVARA
jgi:DNA-binding transcriptional ArsR family regulator